MNKKLKLLIMIVLIVALVLCSSKDNDDDNCCGRAGVKFNDVVYLAGGPQDYHPEGLLIKVGEVEYIIEEERGFLTDDDPNLSAINNVKLGTTIYMEEIDGELQEDYVLILFQPEIGPPIFLWLQGF